MMPVSVSYEGVENHIGRQLLKHLRMLNWKREQLLYGKFDIFKGMVGLALALFFVITNDLPGQYLVPVN